jgi:hypothetical protein
VPCLAVDIVGRWRAAAGDQGLVAVPCPVEAGSAAARRTRAAAPGTSRRFGASLLLNGIAARRVHQRQAHVPALEPGARFKPGVNVNTCPDWGIHPEAFRM